jgi:hypothetical protein
MGMIVEDIHHVYHFFIQIRKSFNKPRVNPLAAPNKNSNKSFLPIFLYRKDLIDEKDYVGPITKQL